MPRTANIEQWAAVSEWEKNAVQNYYWFISRLASQQTVPAMSANDYVVVQYPIQQAQAQAHAVAVCPIHFVIDWARRKRRKTTREG